MLRLVLALAPSVKVAMSGRVIVEIWQLPAPGLSEEALGADVVYGPDVGVLSTSTFSSSCRCKQVYNIRWENDREDEQPTKRYK